MRPPKLPALADPLVIAGRAYRSRLLVGTGKYRDFAQTREAVVASGAQIVTVAIRRTNIGQDAGAPSLIDALPPSEFTYLPNSAGCYTADDAVRTLKLARELLDGHALTKLEVLGDKETLYPNVRETLKAAERLVADGFQVMVYTSDDPDHRARTGADRLRGDHAARVADRLGHGHPQSVEPEAHHRAGQGAGAGRCGRGHRVRRRDRDGAGMRRRADEHGDRAGAGPGAHGARDEARRRSRARRVSRRPHAEQALRGQPQLADVRTHLLIVRALLRGDMGGGARRHPSPLRAAPVTPARVTELCAQAEGPAHCGRLIEAEQLKALPNLAIRDGDTLKVPLYPTGTRDFVDVDTLHGSKTWSLWDYWSPVNVVVLFTTDIDRIGYAMLQRATGQVTALPAEPLLSPDRQHAAVADFCPTRLRQRDHCVARHARRHAQGIESGSRTRRGPT